MLTPEIIDRVDAWLAGRASWIAETYERRSLVAEWRDLAARLSVSSRREPGIESAMRGVLLALVREAWGDPVAFVYWDPRTSGWRGWIKSDQWTAARQFCTEAEGLVAALEASPA